MRIEITESANVYRANVTHDCGHTFKSSSGWNTEAAAKRHGRNLASCVCGVCRDQK